MSCDLVHKVCCHARLVTAACHYCMPRGRDVHFTSHDCYVMWLAWVLFRWTVIACHITGVSIASHLVIACHVMRVCVCVCASSLCCLVHLIVCYVSWVLFKHTASCLGFAGSGDNTAHIWKCPVNASGVEKVVSSRRENTSSGGGGGSD